MRNISEVLEACFKEVPEDFKYRLELRKELESIMSSARYAAPEAMHLQWDRASRVFQYYIGPPKDGWQARIAILYAGGELCGGPKGHVGGPPTCQCGALLISDDGVITLQRSAP